MKVRTCQPHQIGQIRNQLHRKVKTAIIKNVYNNRISRQIVLCLLLLFLRYRMRDASFDNNISVKDLGVEVAIYKPQKREMHQQYFAPSMEPNSQHHILRRIQTSGSSSEKSNSDD